MCLLYVGKNVIGAADLLLIVVFQDLKEYLN